MPITYTNRKGVTFTLHRLESPGKKTRYFFGREGASGVPIDELPSGYHITESPNGVVSLAKDRPILIRPEELAAVERAVQAHPKARRFRVAGKHDRIEIYAQQGPDWGEVYQKIVELGLAPPGKDEGLRQDEERHARFAPVLRFILVDPATRWFTADEYLSGPGYAEWEPTGQSGEADALAEAIVPPLGADDAPIVILPPADARQAATAVGTGGRAATRGGQKSGTVHRLKVTLLGFRPPIWRRIVVPSDVTLARLHDILQVAMGWHGGHLHDFQAGGVSYGDPRMLEGMGDLDERRARLAEVAPRPRNRLRYLYDFGDSWEHEVLVEAVEAPSPSVRYPICLTGKRACPPEDCGGVWGYADLLDALADPKNPDHDDLLDWLGGPFDPEAFDEAAVNRMLAGSGGWIR